MTIGLLKVSEIGNLNNCLYNIKPASYSLPCLISECLLSPQKLNLIAGFALDIKAEVILLRLKNRINSVLCYSV